jgi:hypothetical protein
MTMTKSEQMAILLPRMRRLFQYLETHGVVFIAPGETVINLREPSLQELAAAVDAADLPPLDHARLTVLHDHLFGEGSTRSNP